MLFGHAQAACRDSQEFKQRDDPCEAALDDKGSHVSGPGGGKLDGWRRAQRPPHDHNGGFLSPRRDEPYDFVERGVRVSEQGSQRRPASRRAIAAIIGDEEPGRQARVIRGGVIIVRSGFAITVKEQNDRRPFGSVEFANPDARLWDIDHVITRAGDGWSKRLVGTGEEHGRRQPRVVERVADRSVVIHVVAAG